MVEGDLTAICIHDLNSLIKKFERCTMALSLHLSPFANKLTGRIMNSLGRKLFTATCCDQFTMVSLRPHQSALSKPSLSLKRHDAWHIANVIDSKWSLALTMYNKQTEDVCTYAHSHVSLCQKQPPTLHCGHKRTLSLDNPTAVTPPPKHNPSLYLHFWLRLNKNKLSLPPPYTPR